MKAKLLLMLFLVSLSLGVFASEHHQKKPHAVCKVYEKVATRIPFIFSVQTEDINDCLYLTFQFSLDDADITMLDKDGMLRIWFALALLRASRTASAFNSTPMTLPALSLAIMPIVPVPQ